MNTFYYLNDIRYTQEQLLKYCGDTINNKELLRWEHILSRFILDWFDESDFILQKTSGSTGEPKTFMLKKDIMKKSAKLTCEFFELSEGDTALLCLPVDFIAGKMMVVRALAYGLNLITASPSSDPLKAINRKIDFTAMVPLQVSTVLENEKSNLDLISNLIIGGAEVSLQLEEKLLRTECRCFETFGMTETYSHIALREISNENKERAFTTMKDVTAQCDKQGKLIITAPFISEIPLETNDLVEILTPNKFRWQGRADNLINTGGIKIIPELLERKLKNDIKQRFVFTSIPDNKLGNKLVLAIEHRENPKLKTDIEKIVKSKLNKYEIPKEIFFIEKFPQTTSMKVNRQSVGEMVKKMI